MMKDGYMEKIQYTQYEITRNLKVEINPITPFLSWWRERISFMSI